MAGVGGAMVAGTLAVGSSAPVMERQRGRVRELQETMGSRFRGSDRAEGG